MLQPVLGVGDPRTDTRIDFYWRNAANVVNWKIWVNGGKAAVAFSLFPVTLDDLINISDDRRDYAAEINLFRAKTPRKRFIGFMLFNLIRIYRLKTTN
jgi:uncharacterized protein (DUF1015 family)